MDVTGDGEGSSDHIWDLIAYRRNGQALRGSLITKTSLLRVYKDSRGPFSIFSTLQAAAPHSSPDLLHVNSDPLLKQFINGGAI